MQSIVIQVLISGIVWSWTLTAQDDSSKASKPSAERVKTVRQMYAKLPSDILDIAEPVKRLVAAQNEGRSGIKLLLEDANGKQATIYLLRRLGNMPDSILLSVGRLPARGPEESAVYGLLVRLADKQLQSATQQQRDMVNSVLTVLDEQIAGAIPIPGNQR